MAGKTNPTTTEQRMRGQAITFHDLAVSLYRSRAGCVSRAQVATGSGDFRAASLHIASAENLTQWADTLMGPGWKEYAKPHAYPTPPGPEAEPPGGPYCACADPDCPTPDGQYTHG